MEDGSGRETNVRSVLPDVRLVVLNILVLHVTLDSRRNVDVVLKESLPITEKIVTTDGSSGIENVNSVTLHVENVTEEDKIDVLAAQLT